MGKRKSVSSKRKIIRKEKAKKGYTINSIMDYSDDVVLCKQNVEACFIDNFSSKLMSFNPETHKEYEGVYQLNLIRKM